MTYRSLLFAIGFSLAFMTTPAFAQEPTDYSRPGFYLGGGGLYAIEDFDFANGSAIQNGPGLNFRLGYRFHPNIAVEAMGERVDAFDIDGSSGAGFNTWTGTINGKLFALTDRVQPYGLLGIGAMRAQAKGAGLNTVTETDLAFRYGAGIDSYLTENWVVNLETSYVAPTYDVQIFNYFSLGGGIQYRL